MGAGDEMEGHFDQEQRRGGDPGDGHGAAETADCVRAGLLFAVGGCGVRGGHGLGADGRAAVTRAVTIAKAVQD